MFACMMFPEQLELQGIISLNCKIPSLYIEETEFLYKLQYKNIQLTQSRLTAHIIKSYNLPVTLMELHSLSQSNKHSTVLGD